MVQDEAATTDGLSNLPAIEKGKSTWGFTLRKESNSFRAVIYEREVDTPEQPGLPTLNLYGPRAEIKIRALSMEAYESCMTMLYQGKMKLT
jgi:hypothetical protein